MTVMRAVYDKLNEITASTSAPNNSFFLFESYSARGVKMVSGENTALRDRETKRFCEF